MSMMKQNTQNRGPWVKAGEKIAELRQMREITVTELAEQAGLPSAIWLNDLEAGRRPVPSVFYRSLALHLDMKLTDFASLCLSYYDAKAYEALFGAEAPALKLAA